MSELTSRTWDARYLKIAKDVSEWSKDPSTKVGAVIVGDKHQIVSQGYNGFPRGFKDSLDRLENKPVKYQYTIHAEANALYNALYNGSCVNGSTIYVHGLPCCIECAKAIIQSGIKRVVYDSKPKPNWEDSTAKALELFKEAGVEVQYIEQSQERK